MQKKSFSTNLEKTIRILVKVPQSNEQKEDSMSAFLSLINRMIPEKEPIGLEILAHDSFMRFIIAFPEKLRNIVESNLYARFPNIEISEIDEGFPFKTLKFAVLEMKFHKNEFFPLATHKSLKENFLRNFAASVGDVSDPEKILFQIVVKKLSKKTSFRKLKILYLKLLKNKSEKHQKYYEKTSEPLFIGKIRLICFSDTHENAVKKLKATLKIFKALDSSVNKLEKDRISISPLIKSKVINAKISKGQLLNSDEIATMYHFPYVGSLVVNAVSTSSKRAPAPDILPVEGASPAKDISIFGETTYRNEGKRFGIKRIDRRRHLYVVGKTGSGKSKLLELLLISDIQNGHGCCLIDPHGDLAEELLNYVPKERINDVVYINPSDKDYPIAFNPLEPLMDYEKRQHLCTFFIAIFRKLFSVNWNPRLEHIIRFIVLALLETPDSNILGISRILSDTTFRQRVIKHIKDPIVKSFWTSEFAGYNDKFANDAIVPLINKVGQFIANPILRNMIGQQKNALNFAKFMDEGKIVLINVSKGKLGEENAALLGSMFITKIQEAALSRAGIKEELRRDFYFYVDEFQNFATDAFSSILSEARKYHLNLTIAHQYIAQLPEDVKATAFGNVGSMIVFPVGGDDAAYLHKEFAPVFTAEDIINLDVRDMYIKMSIDGRLTPPFSAKTITVPSATHNFSQEIKTHSRLTYGKNRVSVENEIAKWTSSQTDFSEQISKNSGFPEPLV